MSDEIFNKGHCFLFFFIKLSSVLLHTKSDKTKKYMNNKRTWESYIIALNWKSFTCHRLVIKKLIKLLLQQDRKLMKQNYVKCKKIRGESCVKFVFPLMTFYQFQLVKSGGNDIINLFFRWHRGDMHYFFNCTFRPWEMY